MEYTYNLNFIDEIEFETNAISEFTEEENYAGRLTSKDMANLPMDTKDIGALRRKLSEFFVTKLDSSYPKLEAFCDIKRDTFQKLLRFRNGRNVTYIQLAKFCVGAGLSVEEAKELFGYMGHILNEKSRYDYILICELKNKCDITEYDSDLQECGYPSIFSIADKVSADDE